MPVARGKRAMLSPQAAAVEAGGKFAKRRKLMKKTFVRILLAMLLLLASGSAPVLADGTIPAPPWCCPGCTCSR
jgi:hypothetical protein